MGRDDILSSQNAPLGCLHRASLLSATDPCKVAHLEIWVCAGYYTTLSEHQIKSAQKFSRHPILDLQERCNFQRMHGSRRFASLVPLGYISPHRARLFITHPTIAAPHLECWVAGQFLWQKSYPSLQDRNHAHFERLMFYNKAEPV